MKVSILLLMGKLGLGTNYGKVVRQDCATDAEMVGSWDRLEKRDQNTNLSIREESLKSFATKIYVIIIM